MTIDEELDGRFRNDYHRGLINLIYTANLLHDDFQQILRRKGLSSQQYNVLKILRGFGKQPRSIDFLRKRMLDRKSDISRVVSTLFEKGLVSRNESPDDRRVKDVAITASGLKVLASLDAHERKGDRLLGMLSPEEVKILNAMLDRIRAS